jgi:hypothetical protein
MVYGRTLIWHSWRTTDTEDFFYDLGVQPNRVHMPPILFRNLLRNVYQSPTTCNALMRRSAIKMSAASMNRSPRCSRTNCSLPDTAAFSGLCEWPLLGEISAAPHEHLHHSAAAGCDLTTQIRYLGASALRAAATPLSVYACRANRGDQLAVERMLARLHLRRWAVRVRRRGETTTMVMVSVVVPFLNAGRYLPEAIASVQTQTCHDWELVLIDDGSTDGSAGIVARAASADPRIRLLRRPSWAPASAAAARNLGILEARVEFVAFLDADDIYEPNNLESRLQGSAHPSRMVYGPTAGGTRAERRDWTEGMGREAGLHEPPNC